MKLGKYITNLGVLTGILGAFGVYRQTKQMPADSRRIVMWLVWLLGIVLTVLTIAKDSEDEI